MCPKNTPWQGSPRDGYHQETKTFTDPRDVRRLADAMRRAGWFSRQERLPNGGRAYLWRKQ